MLARILTMIILIAISLAGCRGYIEGGAPQNDDSGGSVETQPDGTTIIKGKIVLPAAPDSSVNREP